MPRNRIAIHRSKSTESPYLKLIIVGWTHLEPKKSSLFLYSKTYSMPYNKEI